MALFKRKKKEEETPVQGPEDNIGLTGALTESKKEGFFSRKKETPQSASSHEPDIECSVCQVLSPPGSTECIACGQSFKPEVESLREPPKESEPEEFHGVEQPEPEIELIQVEEPKKPDIAWTPLPEKERKAAEKQILKEIKLLDKELKRNHISKEDHDSRTRKLRIEHRLEPPESERPASLKEPAAPQEPPEPRTREPEEIPEPVQDDFQQDISAEEVELKSEYVDTSGNAEPALDKEIDEILPVELLALEEMIVEEEPEPVPEPARPEPEQEKKVGFVASRKIFGDKKKQLEEWEESLRAEEQSILANKAALDSREVRLQEKDM
jgi:hypothetical protein